jgi:Transposase DDE domain
MLFAQVVMMCKQLGMVKLGHASIDSTKIKANASDAKTYDIRRIDREIKRLLVEAEAADQQEDLLYGAGKTGGEIPEAIRDQSKRIAKLKELKKQLEQRQKEKINKTDPDAVFMKTQNGIKTVYNAQVAADKEHQVIVATDVTNEASDVEQLLPMVDQAQENTSEKVNQCSADSGYSSGENIKALERRNVDAYIPDREYQAQQRGKEVDVFHKDNFVYDEDRDLYICPEGEDWFSPTCNHAKIKNHCGSIEEKAALLANILVVAPAIKTAGPFPGILMRKSCSKCAKSLIQTPARRFTENENTLLNRLSGISNR